MDNVVSVVSNALERQGLTTKNLERWKDEMPTEEEMVPKDKYTIFDKKEKKYRKGIHSERNWDLMVISGFEADAKQSCPSGREYLRGSTRLGSELYFWTLHFCV